MIINLNKKNLSLPLYNATEINCIFKEFVFKRIQNIMDLAMENDTTPCSKESNINVCYETVVPANKSNQIYYLYECCNSPDNCSVIEDDRWHAALNVAILTVTLYILLAHFFWFRVPSLYEKEYTFQMTLPSTAIPPNKKIYKKTKNRPVQPINIINNKILVELKIPQENLISMDDGKCTIGYCLYSCFFSRCCSSCCEGKCGCCNAKCQRLTLALILLVLWMTPFTTMFILYSTTEEHPELLPDMGHFKDARKRSQWYLPNNFFLDPLTYTVFNELMYLGMI